VNPISFPRLPIAPLFLALISVGAAFAEGPLESAFTNPPAVAHPKTWWHWVSGNVSKEGITADLEAMKRIGLSGAQIFTVDQSAVKGHVVFMSREWRDLVKHALSEAARLKLDISMEGCDGWSESGGHWVEPSQSMQKVVWSETRVQGGKTVSLDVPRPEANEGYYEDISLMAFKTPSGELIPDPVKVTASAQTERPVTGMPSSAAPVKFLAGKGAPPFWIQYEFEKPVACASVSCEYTGTKKLPAFVPALESSDDGIVFRKVCKPAGKDLFDPFPKACGKFFRITFTQEAPKGGWTSDSLSKDILTLSGFKLAGERVNNALARSGMRVDTHLGFDTNSLPAIAAEDVVDLTGKTNWEAPEGNWTLLRMGHTSTGATTHPSTSPGLECDKLSVEAVNSHIDHLFGPVWEDSPDKAGKPFRYILLDSWECGCENWTPHMAETFSKRRGYDLHPWLPALTGRVIGSLEETERFLWDYRRTLADLVAENHYGTFQKRAHEKGMALMSEASGIGIPTVADQLLCKKYCDVPMGEFWVNRSREENIDDPREAASAAHLYGQNIASCEAFTSTPNTAAWKNDPYSLKALGDFEFCNGVNLFIFHRYAHQPWLDRKPGMCMGPWGINFERTNTWWNQGSAWIDYLSRCEALLQQGRFCADLCYFYGEGAPVTVRHAELTPPVPKGYDYDVCNADVILNSMETRDGRITTPSGMSYRVLVLPPSDRMTLPVLKKIAELVRHGAVVWGPRPLRSPSLAGYPGVDQELSRLAGEVWGDCDGKNVVEHAYGAGKIVWGAPLEKVLGVPPDFSASKRDLLFIHRKSADVEIYFVSNQKPEEITSYCTFRVKDKVPELWHPDTGKRQTVALYTTKDGLTTLPIHFDPVGSVFVIFRKSQGSAPHPISVMPEASLLTDAENETVMSAGQNGDYTITWSNGSTKTISVSGLPSPLKLEGPWDLVFPPIDEGKGKPVRATFDKLLSWSDSTDDAIKHFSGTAAYTKSFTLPKGYLPNKGQLILDLGCVKNLAEVSLNGKPLGVLWKEPFQVDIAGAAKQGENSLVIKVTNLWPNRLIGDQKLEEKDRATWSSFSAYKSADELLASGLLGPVMIRAKAVVTLPKFK
jgi:alpha-L-rhamnosidase